MNEEHTEDLLRRAEENDKALENSLISELLLADRKHRKIMNVLIGVVTVLLLLTLGLTYGYLRIQSNTKGLARVSELCEKSNKDKDKEKILWDTLFTFPPPANQTPSDKALVQQLKNIISEKTAHEDCRIP